MSLTIILLVISLISDIILLYLMQKSEKKSQLHIVFSLNIVNLLICTIGQMLQIFFSNNQNISSIYFDYFVYIGTCFLPVSIFFTGLIFANTKIKLKKSYLLLFIIPITSLLVLWTNDFHHLFYKYYSTSIANAIYGPFLYIHTVYSYSLLLIGIIRLLIFSIKNSGFFSKQSILVVLGIIIPVVINLLGSFKIIPMTIYVTTISFTFSILCFAFAILKFDFLKVAPIALQRVVDRMSDCYLVINENNIITDFNKTFLETFHFIRYNS